MTTPFGYFDLIETFAKPGCAICNLLRHDADRYIDSMLYEFVNDPETQSNFRATRGFCNEHAWDLLNRQGYALGTAILYQAVLDEVLTTLRKQAPTVDAPHGNGLAGLFSGHADEESPLAVALEQEGPCRVCQLQEQSQDRYIDTLCSYMDEQPMQQAFQNSEGLCLPHFRGCLRASRNGHTAQLLTRLQTTIWAKLHDELSEFIRKHDYRFAGEKMGSEGTSWRRAVAEMSGQQHSFGVQRRRP